MAGQAQGERLGEVMGAGRGVGGGTPRGEGARGVATVQRCRDVAGVPGGDLRGAAQPQEGGSRPDEEHHVRRSGHEQGRPERASPAVRRGGALRGGRGALRRSRRRSTGRARLTLAGLAGRRGDLGVIPRVLPALGPGPESAKMWCRGFAPCAERGDGALSVRRAGSRCGPHRRVVLTSSPLDAREVFHPTGLSPVPHHHLLCPEPPASAPPAPTCLAPDRPAPTTVIMASSPFGAA